MIRYATATIHKRYDIQHTRTCFPEGNTLILGEHNRRSWSGVYVFDVIRTLHFSLELHFLGSTSSATAFYHRVIFFFLFVLNATASRFMPNPAGLLAFSVPPSRVRLAPRHRRTDPSDVERGEARGMWLAGGGRIVGRAAGRFRWAGAPRRNRDSSAGGSSGHARHRPLSRHPRTAPRPRRALANATRPLRESCPRAGWCSPVDV